MSAPINDGGPAFPCDEFVDHPVHGRVHRASISAELSSGMSLRDHFAGLALRAILSTPNSWRDNDFKPVDGMSNMENNALCAYAQADAMLKVRSL